MPQRMLSNYSEAELESSDSKTTGISPMCLEVKKWNPKQPMGKEEIMTEMQQQFELTAINTLHIKMYSIQLLHAQRYLKPSTGVLGKTRSQKRYRAYFIQIMFMCVSFLVFLAETLRISYQDFLPGTWWSKSQDGEALASSTELQGTSVRFSNLDKQYLMEYFKEIKGKAKSQ